MRTEELIFMYMCLIYNTSCSPTFHRNAHAPIYWAHTAHLYCYFNYSRVSEEKARDGAGERPSRRSIHCVFREPFIPSVIVIHTCALTFSQTAAVLISWRWRWRAVTSVNVWMSNDDIKRQWNVVDVRAILFQTLILHAAGSVATRLQIHCGQRRRDAGRVCKFHF